MGEGVADVINECSPDNEQPRDDAEHAERPLHAVDDAGHEPEPRHGREHRLKQPPLRRKPSNAGANAEHDASVHAAAAEPGGAVDDDEPRGARGHQPDTAGATEAAGRIAGALQVLHTSYIQLKCA